MKSDKTSNSTLYKKLRKAEICNKTGKCEICPMHAGENVTRSKRRVKPKTKKKKWSGR